MEPKKQILILDSDSDQYSYIENTLTSEVNSINNQSQLSSNKDLLQLEDPHINNQQNILDYQIIFFKRKSQSCVSSICLNTLKSQFKEFCLNNKVSPNLLMDEKTLKKYIICQNQQNQGVFVEFTKQKRKHNQINIFNLSMICNYLQKLERITQKFITEEYILRQQSLTKVLFSKIQEVNDANTTSSYCTAFFKNTDQNISSKQQLDTQICKSENNRQMQQTLKYIIKEPRNNNKAKSKRKLKIPKFNKEKLSSQRKITKNTIQIKKQQNVAIQQNKQDTNRTDKLNRIYIKSEPIVIRIEQDQVKQSKVQNWIKNVLLNQELILEVLKIIPSLQTQQRFFIDMTQIQKLDIYNEKQSLLNKILEEIRQLKKEYKSEQIVGILANLIQNRQVMKQSPSEISLKTIIMLLSIADEIQEGMI